MTQSRHLKHRSKSDRAAADQEIRRSESRESSCGRHNNGATDTAEPAQWRIDVPTERNGPRRAPQDTMRESHSCRFTRERLQTIAPISQDLINRPDLYRGAEYADRLETAILSEGIT